ncbi:MAG: hypothetical protein ACR2PX_16085 [Endozoicomonas sp.]|uniref:hypothetical protein n=1 Tax=Endozoicomonas sp. TaxID=1892382 RepID=UPI003D9BE29D
MNIRSWFVIFFIVTCPFLKAQTVTVTEYSGIAEGKSYILRSYTEIGSENPSSTITLSESGTNNSTKVSNFFYVASNRIKIIINNNGIDSFILLHLASESPSEYVQQVERVPDFSDYTCHITKKFR